jgi:hypothetical protein
MQARKEGWGLNCSLGSGWLDRNPDRNLRVECRNPLERVDRDADLCPFRAGLRISGVLETRTSRLAAESPLDNSAHSCGRCYQLHYTFIILTSWHNWCGILVT